MPGIRQPITLAINDAEVRDALKTLQGKIGDLRPAFREIGEKLLPGIRQRFTDSVDVDGNPWFPNALFVKLLWAKDKKRYPREKKPLVWHGHLRDTMRYQVSAFDMMIGTNRDYAAAMQFGAYRYWQRINRMVRIPPRPFLGISTQDRADILEILYDHLTGK
ncbi:putative Mu-like prophage FluMu G protein 2 [Gammaproteobacteria bacterium]